jgi:hypothetical protein
VQANTISVSSGSGIKLFNVRGSRHAPPANMEEVPAREQQSIDFFQHIVGDPNSVVIKDNNILEFTQGVGIILD